MAAAINNPEVRRAFDGYKRACDRMLLLLLPAVVVIPLAMATGIGSGDAYDQSWISAAAVRLLVIAPLGAAAGLLLRLRVARIRTILHDHQLNRSEFAVSEDRFKNRRPALLLRHDGAEVLTLSAFVWRTPALTEQTGAVQWVGDAARKVILIADNGSLIVGRSPRFGPWRHHLRGLFPNA